MSTANTEWISVSDIMTGLMMVFLFVSIVFIEQVDSEKVAIEKIAITFEDYQEELYKELLKEFKMDLKRWKAEVLEDSTIRFNEPDILFAEGSAAIKPKFKRVLSEFIPRYVGVLTSKKFKDSIEELRIEGHTSSDWKGSRDLRERYLNNAHLSQERSFSILEFCFAMPKLALHRTWLTTVLRANGLAFARPILMKSGDEDRASSRRVEFKVKTKAEERIQEILRTIRKTSSPI